MDTRAERYIKKLFRLFLSFLFLSPLSLAFSADKNSAIEKAVSEKSWKDKRWQKLLYYEKRFFGLKTASQNINEDFFVSFKGRRFPKEEFLKSIDVIFENYAAETENFKCVFPQRFIYLREKLYPFLEKFALRKCGKLESWKERVKPHSVSMLFAGGYLNNPSTLYGHTFLRLKRSDDANDLLDYTINYAAETDDKSGIFFAIKGLAGLYPGKFSTVPYYLKVQEYHNLENRDIWEFPLGLNDEEIDRLLNHAWELGKASFPYYFFTKNCSWQILPLLSIAKPEFNLEGKFKTWVIPSDTVLYFLNKFPETRDFTWRPSLSKVLKWEKEHLEPIEREIAIKIAKFPVESLKLADNMSSKKRASILEVSADYLKLRFYSGKIKKDEWDYNSNFILGKRAELGPVETFSKTHAPPASLLTAHNSGRVSLGQIYHKKRFLQKFSWRFAIQDLLDNDDGYLPNSELEIGNFSLLYDNKYEKIYLKEFILANVLSLSPFNSFEKQKSWQMKVSLKEPDNKIEKERGNIIADASFNSGISFIAGSSGKNLAYIMPEMNFGAGGVLRKNYRAGFGAKAGFFSRVDKNFRFLIEQRYISYPCGDKKYLFTNKFSAAYDINKDNSLRFSISLLNDATEINLEFYRYFFPL